MKVSALHNVRTCQHGLHPSQPALRLAVWLLLRNEIIYKFPVLQFLQVLG